MQKKEKQSPRKGKSLIALIGLKMRLLLELEGIAPVHPRSAYPTAKEVLAMEGDIKTVYKALSDHIDTLHDGPDPVTQYNHPS
jgi:hypothetical protein